MKLVETLSVSGMMLSNSPCEILPCFLLDTHWRATRGKKTIDKSVS